MKRKSMKKSILACGISLALVIGSVPVMSFAEDTVTDEQNSALEESQDPEAETSSGEKYVYDSRYDFDSNKISISGLSAHRRQHCHKRSRSRPHFSRC